MVAYMREVVAWFVVLFFVGGYAGIVGYVAGAALHAVLDALDADRRREAAFEANGRHPD